ncbi:GTPase IMAP family member 9-like [Alosa sapidissima]|uniref:GTPase IMAP family member 9-like n=1 Tax=Alosa sapidissima TaxID=34773 RepID=UPI001C09EBB7|nr:GTPase IMAP family member 9-like [Alosa sapidissima]
MVCNHSHHGDAHYLSELRIVLLGSGRSGKRSSGNTILGREEFDTVGRTAQCVKRQEKVAGRQVTVVEAPGWWSNLQLEDTPELTREQIELSVSLCPPGPHALLLVIPVDTQFTESERRSVQEHLELLSERVWSHTIVLFTCGDWLGDTPIEQHIESEGESLHWLVEKCGNRYHVLNNQTRDDHMQVTQLMEKIEEMVAGNREQHYEIVSGDSLSDRWSLSSSAYSSFRSQAGPEEQHTRPVKKASSFDIIPPDMSGESSGDSDRWSFTSSAYSSLRSQTGYDISSLRGSMRSTASSQSSGVGSMSSRAGSVRSSDSRGFKFPNLFKVKKALGDLPEAQEASDSTHTKKEKKKSAEKQEKLINQDTQTPV